MSSNPIKLGNEFRVSTTEYSYLNSTRIVGLSDGSFAVLWGASIGGYVPGSFFQAYVSDVLGQRFAADGTPLGGEFFVNQDHRYACDLGGVIPTTDGGFLATYYSWAPSVSVDQSEIVISKFAADGSRAGSEARINLGTASAQEKPHIAALDGGGYVVVWQTREPGDYPYDLRAQVFDANGGYVGGEIVVNQTLPAYQELPKVTGLTSGGFVVVWNTYGYDADGAGNGAAAMGRVYAADGTPLTDEFVVNSTVAGNQQEPVVTALADGGFVAVWEAQNAEPAPGWGYGIIAQRFDAEGDRVGGEIVVNTQVAGEQRDPAVAVAPDGGFAVVWWNYADYGVHMQRFAADGTAVGEEIRVDTFDDAYFDAYNYQASVEFLADGSCLVSWARASGGSNGAYAIFAQRFAPQTFGTGDGESLAGGQANDWIAGLSGDDTLTGANGRDTLAGEAGNDSLDGGRGADVLDGGDGDDVVLGGTGRFADALSGGAGNDTLDGGNGGDTLAGGEGDDLYILGAGDVIVETAGGGTDTVRRGSSVNLSSSAAEIENVELSGTENLFAIGNARDNRLDGNGGNNLLRGQDGGDTLGGGAGNDRLLGEGGADSLSGGSGNDTLTGGLGNDTMAGDAGGDVFVFGGAFGDDVIADFDIAAAGEIIDLRAVAAITGFADLVANHLTSNGTGDCTITVGANTIFIRGITGSTLMADDFLF